MPIHKSLRPVLELAAQCTLESDIPRELKELVRYCIAKKLVWIQPVFLVAWRPPHDAAGSLFGDRPIVLFPWAKDEKLQARLLAKSRNRLLLLQEGEAALAELRITMTVEKPSDQLSLTDNDEQVLLYLLEMHPSLKQQEDIAAGSRRSRETVSQSLKRLRAAGLVHRPRGERKGDCLTAKGKELAEHLKNSSNSA